MVTADGRTSIPTGAALFSYTNPAGVLVSEASVAAARPIRSGRIFVDELGTETGIAVVNTSAQNAIVTLILRDSSGQESSRRTLLLAAGQQIARYVSQLFPNQASNFSGSLSFDSDQPLAAVTLRENRNSHGEPVFAALPVVDSDVSASSQPTVFPDIAVGGGFTTQIILINPTDQNRRGHISLTGSDGGPFLLRFLDTTVSDISYQINPQGTYRIELSSDSPVRSGYAVVTPDAGTGTPAGSAVFRFQSNGQLIAEAGVPACASTMAMRVPVDNVGAQTGLALANASDVSADLTLTLMDFYGTVEASATRTLPARNHLVTFVRDLFPLATDGYSGLVEIRSTSPIVPIAVKLITNSRNDALVTTLPVVDLMHPSTGSSSVFPQIAIGGGFSTHLILINTDTAGAATGTLNFYQPDGTPMIVPMSGNSASQFKYGVVQGGVRHLYPGNTATVANIALIDPSSNQVATELVINEGNTVRPRMRILDSTGQSRNDFDIGFTSGNPEVATMNSDGSIVGKRAGFSTLTMSVGGVVSTGTITVVRIDGSVSGFETAGIVQDLARRVYLAASQDHTILLAQDVRQTPATYAGISRSAGLKNDLRLQSQFKNPAFLAVNQAEGSLYVTDSANNVIRRVRPGESGRVETLAGTGDAGSRNGRSQEAQFNAPQGIALDARGNLWVADSGNHTIRRINLVTGIVETIAGTPGVEGFADGKGNQARFRSPVGIAVETESAVQQLERERRGEPPPAVSIIVADTGNGVLRRVKETGDVSTLRVESPGPASLQNFSSSGISIVGAPITFSKPAGVGVDAFGNIFVSEPDAGRIKMILPGGTVVSATQANTLRGPKGIAIAQSGRIVVADKESALEIRYGEPQITSVVPNVLSIKGGESVVIRGHNFAPDSVVVIGGFISAKTEVRDTETIVFSAPVLPSGRTTLTVQNRGGLSQQPLSVTAISLSVLPAGYVTTVAGGATFVGDGGVATSAALAYPKGIAVDAVGNLFIADDQNFRIRRIAAVTGIITTVAGDGIRGWTGDGGLAIAAELWNPVGVAVDTGGNLFIADGYGARVRKVDAATGIITTVAGSWGPRGSTGDGGLATAALLYRPTAIALDATGNLFIADQYSNNVRKVDRATGIITTFAGTGEAGFSGDGGPAAAATVRGPDGLAVDPNGNVFVVDSENERVRKIEARTGVISTIAGTGEPGLAGDNGPAQAAQFRLNTGWLPVGITVDPSGNLLIPDIYNARVRKVSATTGIVTTVAGTDWGHSGDNGPATNARLVPTGIAVDSSGNLFVIETGGWVRKIDASTGVITALAGIGEVGLSGDGDSATAARLISPNSVVFDAGGNMFVADSYNFRIRRVERTTGMISTVAGTGNNGYSGDDGQATAADLNSPFGLAIDPRGNLFVSSNDYGAIRRIDAVTGVITRIAGTGRCCGGYSGDGGPATAAELNGPFHIALDGLQGLLVADSLNNRIRRIDLNTGLIATVAGTGELGFSGDGGPAKSARLAQPTGIAVDRAGNLFIADQLNNRIRRVAATGIITTVAGADTPAVAPFWVDGDGGPAILATLRWPTGITIDTAGNLFIADFSHHRIRRVDAGTGIITTVAGSPATSYSFGGDGGPAGEAGFRSPSGLAFDAQGNLFIADSYNNRIRAVKGPLPDHLH